MNNLKKFKYWKEVTKGFYVYATDSSSIKYEILGAVNDYWVEKLGMGKGEDW